MGLNLWVPAAAAAGLLALAVAAPSVAAGPPAAESSGATVESTDGHYGVDNQESVPGMAQMHELMARDNPGMQRMHERVMNDNPGLKSRHEKMMNADFEMGLNEMMPSNPIPTDEGEL